MKYLGFAKAGLMAAVQYRAWIFAITFVGVLQVIIIYYFWQAIGKSGDVTSLGFASITTLISYMVFSNIILKFQTVDVGLAFAVKKGSIVVDMVKPYNLFGRYFALVMSQVVENLLVIMLVPYLIMIIFFEMLLPQTIVHGLGIIVLIFGSFVLIGLLRMAFEMLAFWTSSIWGIMMVYNLLGSFWSGALVPLTMFPDKLYQISQWLPFQTFGYLPAKFYVEPTMQLFIRTVGLQWFWIGLVTLIIAVCWKYVIHRKIVIFGG